jgi:hypothetical protein
MFTNITTDFVFAYGHLWFVLGLAISAATLCPAAEHSEQPPLDFKGNQVIVT